MQGYRNDLIRKDQCNRMADDCNRMASEIDYLLDKCGKMKVVVPN